MLQDDYILFNSLSVTNTQYEPSPDEAIDISDSNLKCIKSCSMQISKNNSESNI